MEDEFEVVHTTEYYTVELHPEDEDGLWYYIVNTQHGVVESMESLKPQALVYCEQFNLLLQQDTHLNIANNMVDKMAEEALDAYTFDKQH